MKKGYYLIGVLCLFYLMFLVGKGVYANWQTDQKLKKIGTEIDLLSIENQNLKSQITYYQTDSFKEKEAREKLGLAKPDEKVVILQNEPQSPAPKETTSTENAGEKKSNPRLWWEYFTKDKGFKT